MTISSEELLRIQDQASPSDIPRLVAEIERMKQYVIDYGTGVARKVDMIEENMQALIAENARLIQVKTALGIERDACVALLSQMASRLGWKTGIALQNQAVVELPSGQVSWTFQEAEAHLFSHLEPYPAAIEEMDITEKYRRVMNPEIVPAQFSAPTDH